MKNLPNYSTVWVLPFTAAQYTMHPLGYKTSSCRLTIDHSDWVSFSLHLVPLLKGEASIHTRLDDLHPLHPLGPLQTA